MKLIQLARFVATPSPEHGHASINQPAVVQIDGLNLSTESPNSAGRAERINRVIQNAVRNSEQHGPG